jgi:poly(3-hydroxyalkanoate) synthetase
MVKIVESRKAEREESSKQLNESLSSKDAVITNLEESIITVKETLNNKNKALQESLETVKKDMALKQNEYNQKLTKANQLVEHYKKVAQISLNKYLESKAKHLGVRVLDIKERLNEKYNFDDIDRVCEDLKGYQVTLSKLPIQLSKKQ